jgi:hypothetical protein
MPFFTSGTAPPHPCTVAPRKTLVVAMVLLVGYSYTPFFSLIFEHPRTTNPFTHTHSATSNRRVSSWRCYAVIGEFGSSESVSPPANELLRLSRWW